MSENQEKSKTRNREDGRNEVSLSTKKERIYTKKLREDAAKRHKKTGINKVCREKRMRVVRRGKLSRQIRFSVFFFTGRIME